MRWRFAGEQTARTLAHDVHRTGSHHTVWTPEVDELKNAQPLRSRQSRRVTRHSAAIQCHDLARLHVLDECPADSVEGTALGGQHPAIFAAPDAQRTDTVRIAHADERVRGHDDEGVGATYDAHGAEYSLHDVPRVSPRHQVGDEFAVDGRFKDDALLFQCCTQGWGVDQVSVVGKSQRTTSVADNQWLCIDDQAPPAGRVPNVSACHRPGECCKALLVEDLRHQPHGLVVQDLVPCADGDPRALLAPMLQGIETIVGGAGGAGLRTADNAKNPTFLVQTAHASHTLISFSSEPLQAAARSTTGARTSDLPETSMFNSAPPVVPSTASGTPISTAASTSACRSPAPTVTTIRDGASPKRSASGRIPAGRERSAPVCPLLYDSATVTERPPSLTSCADRINPRRIPVRHSS